MENIILPLVMVFFVFLIVVSNVVPSDKIGTQNLINSFATEREKFLHKIYTMTQSGDLVWSPKKYRHRGIDQEWWDNGIRIYSCASLNGVDLVLTYYFWHLAGVGGSEDYYLETKEDGKIHGYDDDGFWAAPRPLKAIFESL